MTMPPKDDDDLQQFCENIARYCHDGGVHASYSSSATKRAPHTETKVALEELQEDFPKKLYPFSISWGDTVPYDCTYTGVPTQVSGVVSHQTSLEEPETATPSSAKKRNQMTWSKVAS